jgi:UDP-GlcNAc:undecaprenyl-phosphate GlcNAc-1-phosphate transferase
VPPAAHQLLFIASVSFVIALLSTPLVARLAVRWGWLDRPDGRRKLHHHPVPTVGGVAVVIAFAIAAAHLQIVARKPGGPADLIAIWRPLVASAIVLMLLGLVDDARGVRPLTKLLVQTVVGAYLFACGFRIESVSNPFGGPIELGAFALPVTLLWLVGMSNALNLIDGLDGLAAGLSLVSTVGLLFAALFTGRLEVALVAAALAGALVGFLPYNFNPARIFLGDCGSLPVGLVLAAIAVRGSMKASAALVVSLPLLALALPILDVALAIVRRFVRRKPVFVGDHDHIHHRLVELGLTPRRAVITLYAVGMLFTVLALAIAIGPMQVMWASLAVVLLVIGGGVRALGYWEVTEIQKTFFSRLLAGLRASGDAALRGLEQELAHTPRFDDAWDRVCETAWRLGFTELHLTPRPDFVDLCPERHSFMPRPDLRPAARHGELEPVTDATWSIEVMTLGAIVAEVVARRPLQPFDFDPRRFAAVLQKQVASEVRAADAAEAEVAVGAA